MPVCSSAYLLVLLPIYSPYPLSVSLFLKPVGCVAGWLNFSGIDLPMQYLDFPDQLLLALRIFFGKRSDQKNTLDLPLIVTFILGGPISNALTNSRSRVFLIDIQNRVSNNLTVLLIYMGKKILNAIIFMKQNKQINK